MPVPLITRILLADDHEMVRGGLRLVLESQPDLRVAAEASDGEEALRIGISGEIDLAVLDVSMPMLTGLQVARELHRHRPELQLLMLSAHDNEQYFFEALKAGASGYVLKSSANTDLIDACRATMRGESFVYPPAAAAIVRDYLEHGDRDGEGPSSPLTAREQVVIKQIAEGLSSEEIAKALIISKRTVDRHRENILEKLGMRNRVELTRYAIKRGLVEP